MTAIILLLALQVKHLLVDFFMQRPYQYRNKGIWLHPGGILHAAEHAVFSAFSLTLFVPQYVLLIGIIAVCEFIAHYLIDYSKVNICKNYSWSKTVDNRLEIYSDRYFHALGVDQFLHQLTYLAMVAILI